MIQVTGTITATDGLSKYIDAILNLNISDPNKFAKKHVSVDVFTTHGGNYKKINTVFEKEYVMTNPSFDSLQEAVKSDLETAFPTLSFEIV
jgi:hypothetical protein